MKSLGPSNDEPALVACEISRAAWVRSDAGWARFEDEGAFDWDPTRPLAEQWPWNGHETREAFAAHLAAGDAQIEALIEEVAKAPPRALSEEQLAGIGAGPVGAVAETEEPK